MAEVVAALEGEIAPIECITADADGALVCAREGERALPHQAAVDPGTGVDRPHAERHDPGPTSSSPSREPKEKLTV